MRGSIGFIVDQPTTMTVHLLAIHGLPHCGQAVLPDCLPRAIELVNRPPDHLSQPVAIHGLDYGGASGQQMRSMWLDLERTDPSLQSDRLTGAFVSSGIEHPIIIDRSYRFQLLTASAYPFAVSPGLELHYEQFGRKSELALRYQEPLQLGIPYPIEIATKGCKISYREEIPEFAETEGLAFGVMFLESLDDLGRGDGRLRFIVDSRFPSQHLALDLYRFGRLVGGAQLRESEKQRGRESLFASEAQPLP